MMVRWCTRDKNFCPLDYDGERLPTRVRFTPNNQLRNQILMGEVGVSMVGAYFGVMSVDREHPQNRFMDQPHLTFKYFLKDDLLDIVHDFDELKHLSLVFDAYKTKNVTFGEDNALQCRRHDSVGKRKFTDKTIEKQPRKKKTGTRTKKQINLAEEEMEETSINEEELEEPDFVDDSEVLS